MAGYYQKAKTENRETKKTEKKNNKQTKRKKKNPEYGQIFRKKKKKKNNNMVASDVEMKNKSWFSIERTILKCINPNKAWHFKGSYCLDRINLTPSPPSHISRKNNLILTFRSV